METDVTSGLLLERPVGGELTGMRNWKKGMAAFLEKRNLRLEGH
jgi:hypothetical protein